MESEKVGFETGQVLIASQYNKHLSYCVEPEQFVSGWLDGIELAVNRIKTANAEEK